MPELAGLGKARIEAIKAFFSKACDWLRLPYDRGYVDLPRSSVPVATTNDSQYLQDKTGNRRYMPVACTTIDVTAIARDREQIFAEALLIYRDGTPWWLDKVESVHQAAAAVAERESEDPWHGVIQEWANEAVHGGRRGDVGIRLLDALYKHTSELQSHLNLVCRLLLEKKNKNCLSLRGLL